jgi:dienelactone hydrolase
MRRRHGLVLVILLAFAAAGCGGRTNGVSVSPGTSLSTAPLVIRVTGLQPNAKTTIAVSSRDAAGKLWSSSAVFETNKFGNIDTSRASALSGSYRGVWRMGLVSAMKSGKASSYRWGSRAQRFRITASQGARTVSSTFTRKLDAVEQATPTLAKDGFIGDYFVPRSKTHKPALLVFGGSEGGLASSFLAANLASNGYPALALAYFGEPGLPPTLDDVPLEYFVTALRWLDKQPQVDASHVFTLGVSRGSEAAQLLAVDYPQLVHGVVGVVASDLVNCSYPSCGGSPWTLHAVPLPYEPSFGQLVALDEPKARIPVEQIKGPILYICAPHDENWPSCVYSHIAMALLQGDKYAHQLVIAPDSFHEVGALVPYTPSAETEAGRGFQDERGRATVWPQLLAFLAHSR